MIKKVTWFERQFAFGSAVGMLPFYIERLDGTFARLHEKVSGYSEAMLSHKLDGKWSVKENIAHLAEVGRISDTRVGEIKAGVELMSPAMLPLTKDYNVQSIGEVLKFFRESRTKSVSHYKQIQEADAQKQSTHPRLKVLMTVVDLAWFDAEHDDHHLVRINEILLAAKKTPVS